MGSVADVVCAGLLGWKVLMACGGKWCGKLDKSLLLLYEDMRGETD